MLGDNSEFTGVRFSSVDERGSFSKLFGKSSQGNIAFEGQLKQANYVKNELAGTLRGLHFQVGAFAETKVIHCIKGSVWDVLVDLRTGSTTYKQWYGQILSASNLNFMKVPRGFAHGYITLENDTELIYFSDNELSLESERGIIWNDPSICIDWPLQPLILSAKDQNWPMFENPAK